MTKRILPFMALVLHIFLLQSNSLAQSLPLFGPNKYARAIGAPNTYSDTFQTCNTGATYNLIVENGEGGEDRLSSASITLNGEEIVKENEFNQKVDRIEKTISLNEENTLYIKLASGPGGFIKVSIYCVANCLEVSVTSPSDGNTINRSTAIIQGRLYNASGEVGVILRSSGASGQVSGLAQTQGSSPETSSGQAFARVFGGMPFESSFETFFVHSSPSINNILWSSFTIPFPILFKCARISTIFIPKS